MLQNEERYFFCCCFWGWFFFLFCFVCLFVFFTFQNHSNLFWVYQNGNFLPGKSISCQEKNQEKWLCPIRKIFLLRLWWDVKECECLFMKLDIRNLFRNSFSDWFELGHISVTIDNSGSNISLFTLYVTTSLKFENYRYTMFDQEMGGVKSGKFAPSSWRPVKWWSHSN